MPCAERTLREQAEAWGIARTKPVLSTTRYANTG
jgi:hypothetical protein